MGSLEHKNFIIIPLRIFLILFLFLNGVKGLSITYADRTINQASQIKKENSEDPCSGKMDVGEKLKAIAYFIGIIAIVLSAVGIGCALLPVAAILWIIGEFLHYIHALNC